MSYKEFCKSWKMIIVRLEIIKKRLYEKMPVNNIASYYSMWRNSVTNICNLYNSLAPPELKNLLENWKSLTSKDLHKYCGFLKWASRRPKSNKRQASVDEENKIKSDFEKIKVWAKKLVMILRRKGEIWNLTLAKVRWIYKRNSFRVQKVITKNWETRSLYNYQTIWAFEDTHFDTKELADAKSLPVSVYENLKHNKHLPIYEWNFIDVASRSRFMAYSRWKSSSIWLQFLVFVISHIRYCWVVGHIRIHTDWWAEFFSWSKRKQDEWNSILALLNADIDCYNPNWDIKKNLIERSHRSDDEEFLIPFWESFKTRQEFMIQAQEYADYWNKLRSHSWKWMEWKTPREKLLALGIYQADRILNFKVLDSDTSFYILQKHLEYFLFQKLLKNTSKEKLISDRKTCLDLITRYPHLKFYAQNVLTYYQMLLTP